jgi:hypothetical protein
MSLGTQFARFAQRSARWRQSTFGVDTEGKLQRVDYNSGAGSAEAYYTPILVASQLEGLNLRGTYQTLVRIVKTGCDFTPQTGKLLRFLPDGPTVRISEVSPSHAIAPEWILGCSEP